MPRYRLDIAYDGTRYNGWQRQPNDPTIQCELEQALQTILRKPIEITASGRTDAGVHARGQVAHADLDIAETPECFLRRVNSMIPNDIRIRSIKEVDPSFHARFDAVSRTYHYSLATLPDPLQPLRWNLPKPVDSGKLRESAVEISGTHDFRLFALMDPVLENCFCTITESRFETLSDGHLYIITGNRFLRNMVRRLVGMMVAMGAGELPMGSITQTLEGHPPIRVPSVAPAIGLVLERVLYVEGGH